jgi:hypothetical protein
VPRAHNEPQRRALLPFSASYSLEHAELASALFRATVIERALPFAPHGRLDDPGDDDRPRVSRGARAGGQRTVAELYAQLEGVDGAKPSDPFAGE